jgi:hypothetical protein
MNNKGNDDTSREEESIFKDLCDLGLEPLLLEQMKRNYGWAFSVHRARHGVDEKYIEMSRLLEQGEVEKWFATARRIESARRIGNRLKPCRDCGTSVSFHFRSSPEGELTMGYVLCPKCRKATDFTGSEVEIVDKWNRDEPGG